jgi:hypothetical protein
MSIHATPYQAAQASKSETFRRLNPQIFAGPGGTLVAAPIIQGKRVRQDKPMNKLEEEFGEWLARTFPAYRRYPQAIRLKLANGVTYTPDWFCPDILKFYEVKGPINRDDAVVKLKQAPHEHPWARFSLVWKDESTGEWQEQEIKP